MTTPYNILMYFAIGRFSERIWNVQGSNIGGKHEEES